MVSIVITENTLNSRNKCLGQFYLGQYFILHFLVFVYGGERRGIPPQCSNLRIIKIVIATLKGVLLTCRMNRRSSKWKTKPQQGITLPMGPVCVNTSSLTQFNDS
jgi:hypothetical protein